MTLWIKQTKNKLSNIEVEEQKLKSLAAEGGLILLYHGVWSKVPQALADGLHNVHPEQLRRHLEKLKQHFAIVSVDEFVEARSRRGLAAVSFDDGYGCVLNEGLQIFRDLEIPFTVYVNGSTISGGVFWRDKIRYIQANGLVDKFESFMNGIEVSGRFYRYTKSPDNNSLHVVAEIDRFLDSIDQTHKAENFCLDFPSELIADDLVTWGNHSHSHYVMSSLTERQQFEEIENTTRLLASKPSLNLSQVFSIPFGEQRDFNEATIDAARQCGYSGLLLSRGKAHLNDLSMSGLPVFERLMPREGSAESGLLAALS